MGENPEKIKYLITDTGHPSVTVILHFILSYVIPSGYCHRYNLMTSLTVLGGQKELLGSETLFWIKE